MQDEYRSSSSDCNPEQSLTAATFEAASVPASWKTPPLALHEAGPNVPKQSDDLVITKSKLDSKKVKEGEEAADRLISNRNRTWADYCAVAVALGIGRATAMLEAKCNAPFGKRYCVAYSKWLRCHERLGTIDQADRKHLLDCFDNLPAIEAWRAGLSEAKQLRCNHPDVVLREWRKNQRAPKGPADPAGPLKEARDPIAIWNNFSRDEKRQCLEHEGRSGMAAIISPSLLTDLTDHVVGLEASSASASTNLAIQLTKILRHGLSSETEEPNALDRINAKLKRNGRTFHDLVVAITMKVKTRRRTRPRAHERSRESCPGS